MARGRKPKQLPPNDPEQYVQQIQRGRTRWHPDLVPAIMSWIVMLDTAYRKSRAETLGRVNKMPQAVRDGMVAQMTALIDALGVLAAQVAEPWGRQEWYGACARVMEGIEPEPQQEADTAKPAG